LEHKIKDFGAIWPLATWGTGHLGVDHVTWSTA